MKKQAFAALALSLLLPLLAHAAQSQTAAYLFAYFTGNSPSQEQICYALSYDGFNYTPLNDGNPVIASDTIALTGCVRDPHILRGRNGDNHYYMVATDMKSSLGWQSNHGLVLMRSADLVHWEHHAVDFQQIYPGTCFANSKYVWAPQTIWDEEAGKYMIYFAWGDNDVCRYQTPYYVYANEDFSDLEKDANGQYVQPQMLFDRGFAAIDMDIVQDDAGTYHCFYKDESTAKGITQCTFQPGQMHDSSLWNYNYPKLSYAEAAEGCGVFRLADGNWCLMWDCYNNGHYTFTRSADLYNFTKVQDTATGGTFTPRHGTVLPITSAELAVIKRAYMAPAQAPEIDASTLADNYSSWMSMLPDGAYVANLSLPGSHDSGSSDMAAMAKTQALTIRQQLDKGVRVLDVRVNSDLKIAHGIYASSSNTFESTMQAVEAFLTEHPTEFVIMFTKAENVSDSKMDAWKSSMAQAVASHAQWIVPFHRDARVGNLRGKIMLLNRDEFTDARSYSFATNWGDNQAHKEGLITTSYAGINASATLWIQDNYSYSNADDKDAAVRQLLAEAEAAFASNPTEIKWFANFISGYKPNALGISSSSAIQDNANRTNQLIADNLTGAPAGMVLADYAAADSYNGKTVVDALILNNFAYCTRNPQTDLVAIATPDGSKFLAQNQSAAWGTRAGLSDYAFPFKMVAVGEGAYKLHAVNVSNGGDSQWLGTNCYTDGAATPWTIDTDVYGLSTLSNSGSMIGHAASAVNMGAAGDDAKWRIITATDAMESMEMAAPDYPTDLTAFVLTAPTLLRNNSAFRAVWSCPSAGATYKTDGDGNGSTNVIEVYNNTFNLSQTVFLRKGYYVLRADGFYRAGDKSSSKTRRQQNNESLNAVLYAGGQQAPLMSIYDGAGVGSNFDGIINDLTAAGKAISAGKYSGNVLVFKVENDGLVTLGIKKETGIGSDWCAFNNLSLQYCGAEETFDAAGIARPLDVTQWLSQWRNTGNASSFGLSANPNGEYKDQTGNNFFESWNATAITGHVMEQTLTNIPDGAYTFTACLMGGNAETVHLFCGDSKSALNTDAQYGRYVSVTGIAADGVLTIGVAQDAAVADPTKWVAIADWSLRYEGKALPLEPLLANFQGLCEQARELLDHDMNATVCTALENAMQPGELANSVQAQQAIDALTMAIAGAQTSAEQYAASRIAIDNMYDLIESTNVYTPEAYAAYKALADNADADYQAGRLTEPVYDPYKAVAWHTSPTDHSNFLLSAFGTADYQSALHANTWSTEGEGDGSHFSVPFVEYWVDDAQALGENTWTATLTGLEPGMSYRASALVRVRLRDGASGPKGIAMRVGDGNATAVTTGSAYGKFYMSTFTAAGNADENGQLAIAMEVAADNNISWLSLKNLRYELDVPNVAFTLGDALQTTVCTYAKDMNSNAALSQLRPVAGWDIAENGDARAGGLYAYGSEHCLGGAGYPAPAVGPDGSDEGMALGVLAVWGARSQYTMPIALPAGKYVMSVKVYNGAGTGAIGKNLIGFIADNGAEYLAKTTKYAVGQWTTETITFTLDQYTEGRLSAGYLSGGNGSGSNPHLFIDSYSMPNVMLPTAKIVDITPANCVAPATNGFEAGSIVLTDAADYNVAQPIEPCEAVYERTFAGDYWQAWFVPFDTPLADIAPYLQHDGQYSDVVEYKEIDAEGYVVCTVLEKDGGSVLRANTPYLVRPRTEYAGTPLSFAATRLEAAPAAIDPAQAEAGLYGTLREMPMTEGGEDANDPWALSRGQFYQASHSGQTLKAFRVFMIAPQAQGRLGMPVRIDDDTEGLGLSGADMEQGVMYDLQGRRIEHPVPGVHILNGVKILIK